MTHSVDNCLGNITISHDHFNYNICSAIFISMCGGLLLFKQLKTSCKIVTMGKTYILIDSVLG